MLLKSQIKKIIQTLSSPALYVILIIYFRKMKLKIFIMDPKGKLSQYVCYLEPALRELAYLNGGSENLKPIIINPGAIPNSELHKIYSKEYDIRDFYNSSIFSKIILKILYSLNYVGYKNIILLKNHLFINSSWLWNDLPSIINFTDEQNIEGNKLLSEMNISKDDKFIILHLREEHYYDQYVDKSRNPEAGNNYSNRNPQLETYESSIKYLIENNYKVIKTGFPGSKCGIKIEGFVDYENNFRSEFGDIFLHSKAEFVISGACGNFHLASVFGTPSILTNSYHFEVIPMLNSDMSLPVIYKSKTTGKILSVSEMLVHGVELSSDEFLSKNDLMLVPNTKDELLVAIKEMHLKVIDEAENLRATKEEIKLKKLFKNYHIGYAKQGIISKNWVKKYSHIIY